MMQKLLRLSLAATLALSPLGLAAQAPAPQAPASEGLSSSHAEQASTAHPVSAEGPEAAEAHEAAEHHPAPMVLFGKAYGNGPAFLVQLLNFAIYVAGLVFLLKGPLSAMFKTRREELETALAKSEHDRAEGEAQLKELAAKMAGLEGELAGILSKAEADAEVEKQRVLDSARAEAQQILAQARSEIGLQKRQAEQELRALVAELAVEGAAKRLEAQLAGPEAGQALDRAIQQIGGIQ